MKAWFARPLSILQKLGQSLAIPVSVLPAAGLMVALGRALQYWTPEGHLLFDLGKVCYSAGLAVFEHLPLVFSVGVAIGFTEGAGVAGLSAAIGYFTLLNLLGVLTEIRALDLPLNTGVFGGVAVGLLTARLYNLYHKVQLPPVLGFFSGTRLIPILTVFATVGLGLLFGFLWPPVQTRINTFGHWVMDSPAGPACYAAGKRLLIPVGLHHVYYAPFLFQFGEFTTEAGRVVHGDSPRYYAGDPTAGAFMASEFPIMLFGLPAAALAIALRASPRRRKAAAGIMMSAALTSMITGITEPIEFGFIFVAPPLYVLHVCLAFVSGLLTQAFDIHLGYTFSASLIDFVLGYFNAKNSFFLWAVVGPVVALLYFGGFYGFIGLFRFKTLGREGDQASATAEELPETEVPAGALAAEVLAALGGAANLLSLEACITRLRVVVVESGMVDRARLRALGATGIFDDRQRNLQIVFGTGSDLLREQIHALIDRPREEETIILRSPLKGRVLALEHVPDRTFAQKLLGSGVAIDPAEGVVYAPFEGTVVHVPKTGHALGLSGPRGLSVLIHIGIDTVKMNGVGFHALVKRGDSFRQGDHLVEFDLEKIQQMAPSAITPVVITNSGEFGAVRAIQTSGSIEPGDRILEIELARPGAK